jgi:hypothetical protein
MAFQADPKSSQIQQSPDKRKQNKSKKKAWNSLDSLVRIEPFQGVALTPQGKKSCLAPFPRNWPSWPRRASFDDAVHDSTISEFR